VRAFLQASGSLRSAKPQRKRRDFWGYRAIDRNRRLNGVAEQKGFELPVRFYLFERDSVRKAEGLLPSPSVERSRRGYQDDRAKTARDLGRSVRDYATQPACLAGILLSKNRLKNRFNFLFSNGDFL
jgi:hypothetical protein